MMSLYDYLGHAAGMQLGEEVAKKATSIGCKNGNKRNFKPWVHR